MVFGNLFRNIAGGISNLLSRGVSGLSSIYQGAKGLFQKGAQKVSDIYQTAKPYVQKGVELATRGAEELKRFSESGGPQQTRPSRTTVEEVVDIPSMALQPRQTRFYQK